MENFNIKRYSGVIVFVVLTALLLYFAITNVVPKFQEIETLKSDITQKESELAQLDTKCKNVRAKIKRLKDAVINSQKKIYSPLESDLGNETIFFTLYNDVIEMIHANSVKIKSINYTYNPSNDKFVQSGKDIYFVCDVNMELVSNYINLGKLIQDLYQYPYYIRINDIDIKPYAKDKKILISNVSLRLYAHTVPDVETPDVPLSGATTGLPQ